MNRIGFRLRWIAYTSRQVAMVLYIVSVDLYSMNTFALVLMWLKCFERRHLFGIGRLLTYTCHSLCLMKIVRSENVIIKCRSILFRK